MTVHEAYEKLGLEPLDSWLQRHNDGPHPRRLGATTWMLAVAATHVIWRGNAVLVGHNLSYAAKLVDDCIRDFIRHMHPNLSGMRAAKRAIRLGDGLGWLRWESERTMPQAMVGIDPESYREFWDGRWKLKALERAKGPFARVRRIVAPADDGIFYAYDEDGEYIMRLTRQGAVDMVEADPMRIERVGW